MKIVKDSAHRFVLFAAIAIGLLPAAGAQAQYYGRTQRQTPVPNDRPYAVEVAPNTYIFGRPATSQSYPYVGSNGGSVVAEPNAPALGRPHRKADRALIEELRKRPPVKRTTINTSRDENKKRVIQADAEITILGPDRMSIRLFRKGRGGNANVLAE